MSVPGASTRRASASRQRVKAAIRVAQRIVHEIGLRRLAAGSILPPEHKMVARYRVARGTLREALRFLELHGVIHLKPGPGGGPVIGDPDPHHLAGNLALLLQFVGTPFRAIIEARYVIEPALAALAAARATPAALAEIRRCITTMRAALADSVRFHEENRRFHDLLAIASGNPVFAFLVPALHAISDSSGLVYDPPVRRRALRGNTEIYRAIARRDAAAAQATTERFLGGALAYLERAHPVAMTRQVTWADVSPRPPA